VLFFTGLAQASAPGAAFIHKTLFLWVAVLAVPFLGERHGTVTLVGLAVLLAGQALVVPPAGLVWGAGETMILAATLLWAVETVLVRRLLRSVASDVLAALRLGLGVVILIGFLLATGGLGVVATLTPTQWAWTALTGFILAGYVGLWFAALQRAPATVVTSVLVVGAVVTGALTAVGKGAAPTPQVVVGYLLIVAATALVIAWTWIAARSVAARSTVLPERVAATADDR